MNKKFVSVKLDEVEYQVLVELEEADYDVGAPEEWVVDEEYIYVHLGLEEPDATLVYREARKLANSTT
jgi:hypothetical protein